MQVTANAGGRELVVRSPARPALEKRRSLKRDARSNTECISKEAAPPVSPIASGELSEAEAIRRATAIAPRLTASIACIAGVCMPYASAW